MPKGDSAMIGNRRGHPPSSASPLCFFSPSIGDLAGGPWRWGPVDREPGNAKWREWHGGRHSEQPAQVRRCRSHRCRRRFCAAGPGKVRGNPKEERTGCRGCIQSPRQKVVRGLIRGRQSCGWLSRQSYAPRWRCAGASILEVPTHPMSIPLSHVIVPPVALGQAWDSSLVAPRQMRSKTQPASQTSPSSAHRHSMILVAYFG
ncbi:hypothetical protein BGZ61DRAFT_93205 [Ilyonectria robusta]|uniref:uncharacterized protein n=1 Tax=Ilyonectria robusta TaxID=1079257 RepID=UPI001E8DE003|nr:uncharacterized protein BGZ61DRAFT_93205 [Ilyonectria robusta]KAH8736342.1 hypothetical protein BGZ61DRAFT_93205 [Ilyonectria robusta]